MKVKKYQADNMQEAMLKVKSDLGSDAIILHSRKFKKGGFFGFFAKKKVEVVATVEPEPATDSKDSKELKGELDQMKGMMNNLMGEIQKSKEESLAVTGNPILQKVVEALLNLGIDYSTAQDLARKIVKKTQGQVDDAEKLQQILKAEFENVINDIEPIKLEDDKTKVVAMVGPTGVGKTTTLAKLAANFSLLEGKKVGLVTADTYRIAAVDQLKTYSEIIDLPLEVAFTPQELTTAIDKYQGYDLVLVDTAGRSQNNQMHISELKSFIKKSEIDEVYLVLSATTKTSDLKKIIKVYTELEINKLILTKLDETDSLGIVFEAALEANKPLSYVTVGQDVPEDIKLPESKELIDDILEGLDL
ncbi:flagellar GTP-binding protein [Halobacteroides halobius DSM 5150]|uniref:Flagellar biosynthesis protein FlhF n=1 Tax=Halobacteroides halobius (strain ATCC 35273 / DSM 5150 / MD-1) TaxID=748449 RepID=L0K5T9_HALHC|nr:flagellar biosynthesis protein FlhF [Halobacteroides halobius]AGB40647.1 flagellar GTP-binding protein [Halobacteroides halobius DSM 5150]